MKGAVLGLEAIGELRLAFHRIVDPRGRALGDGARLGDDGLADLGVEAPALALAEAGHDLPIAAAGRRAPRHDEAGEGRGDQYRQDDEGFGRRDEHAAPSPGRVRRPLRGATFWRGP